MGHIFRDYRQFSHIFGIISFIAASSKKSKMSVYAVFCADSEKRLRYQYRHIAAELSWILHETRYSFDMDYNYIVRVTLFERVVLFRGSHVYSIII